MIYPQYFTPDDIMEFEYEYQRICELSDPASVTSINAELQAVAQDLALIDK